MDIKKFFVFYIFVFTIIFSTDYCAENQVMVNYRMTVQALKSVPLCNKDVDLCNVKKLLSFKGLTGLSERHKKHENYQTVLMPSDDDSLNKHKNYLTYFCSVLSKDLMFHYSKKPEKRSMSELINHIWGKDLGTQIYAHYNRIFLENASKYGSSLFCSHDFLEKPSQRLYTCVGIVTEDMSDEVVLSLGNRLINAAWNALMYDISCFETAYYSCFISRCDFLLTVQKKLGLGVLMSEKFLSLIQFIKKPEKELRRHYFLACISACYFIRNFNIVWKACRSKLSLQQKKWLACFKKCFDYRVVFNVVSTYGQMTLFKILIRERLSDQLKNCDSIWDLQELNFYKKFIQFACNQELLLDNMSVFTSSLTTSSQNTVSSDHEVAGLDFTKLPLEQ